VSTVRHADQILVLDGGRIVERGAHDELVALNGLYADLHRRQLLEEELAAS
jgi:ABC-type multidrug transport system fused ATPase/permease subunit